MYSYSGLKWSGIIIVFYAGPTPPVYPYPKLLRVKFVNIPYLLRELQNPLQSLLLGDFALSWATYNIQIANLGRFMLNSGRRWVVEWMDLIMNTSKQTLTEQSMTKESSKTSIIMIKYH